MSGLPRPPARFLAISLCGLALAGRLSSSAAAQAGPGASTLFDRSIAAAEASLRGGHPEDAEKAYREAIGEGWLLLGTMDRVEDRLPAAESAFRIAASEGSPRAQEALALLLLQKGDSVEAVKILSDLTARDSKSVRTRRLLAQALMAGGQLDGAVKVLEETRSLAPADLEVAFALADAYLRRKEIEPAARLFAQIVSERPLPQTHVLIGGAYRDAREFARADAELQAALKQDPRVRRAHYLLAMAILDQKGTAGVEQAVPHFQAELRLAPEDPATNLELGVALVEGQRPAEAVDALALAARSGPPSRPNLLPRPRAGRRGPAVGSGRVARAGPPALGRAGWQRPGAARDTYPARSGAAGDGSGGRGGRPFRRGRAALGAAGGRGAGPIGPPPVGRGGRPRDEDAAARARVHASGRPSGLGAPAVEEPGEGRPHAGLSEPGGHGGAARAFRGSGGSPGEGGGARPGLPAGAVRAGRSPFQRAPVRPGDGAAHARGGGPARGSRTEAHAGPGLAQHRVVRQGGGAPPGRPGARDGLLARLCLRNGPGEERSARRRGAAYSRSSCARTGTRRS